MFILLQSSFYHSLLCFNASNAVLMYRLVQNNNILFVQCVLMHVFRKWPGCALIRACALIRTNTVCENQFSHYGARDYLYTHINSNVPSMLCNRYTFCDR